MPLKRLFAMLMVIPMIFNCPVTTQNDAPLVVFHGSQMLLKAQKNRMDAEMQAAKGRWVRRHMSADMCHLTQRSFAACIYGWAEQCCLSYYWGAVGVLNVSGCY